MSTDSAAARPQKSLWGNLFQGLQKMGRSLQLPIAVLPAAGIINRLGQPDVFGADGLGWDNVAKVMAGAGGALLDGSLGLPLLFCIGVAIGMAKKSDGSTALAAVVGFLVYYTVLRQFPKDCPEGTKDIIGGCLGADDSFAGYTYQNPGVFGGIVMGLLTAYLWQRYHRTKLVDWLGFFNGRRLVPIIMTFVAIAFAALCLWIWPPIGDALESFSDWLVGLGSWGSGIFGLANRALLVIGLHQFLNGRVDGGDVGVRREGRLQLLGRPDRLRHQLEPGDEAVADHSDRSGLRGRVLRDLPVRDHQVQPPDPRSRAGRGGRGDGARQRQVRRRPGA